MVRFDVCSPDDVDELVRLLAQVFTERDPPAIAVGLSQSEFEALVELYRLRAGHDGLSIVARSGETGEMVGALLAEDSSTPFPDGVDRLSPKFDPIFDILGELDVEYRCGRVALPGDSMHVFLLGVSLAFAGQQVAQALVAKCLDVGGRRGYRMAVTEATNNVSRHIFRKLGFVERVRRSYRNHVFDGEAVFASIVDHDGPVLLDKVLV